MYKIRHFLSFLALVFVLAAPQGKVFASHNMGIDLTYLCIDSCTIRIALRAYRDCSGITTIPNAINFTGQGVGCTLPLPVTNWSAQVTTEVTPVCPGWPTQCNTPGAQINGVQEYYWQRDYNICVANCDVYNVSWGDCCRNGSITSGAANNGIFTNATTINLTLDDCNSSPQFTNPPVPYICAGQPFTFNQGAWDPDGDSLVYFFGPCMQNAGGQVNYNPGYSPLDPLGPTWTCVIDPATGDITITPVPGTVQTAVICIYVQEFRDSVLIGTIVRDMQITVLNCPGNNTPQISPISNVTGGTQNGNTVNTCVGSPICFDVDAFDPDVTQAVFLTWSMNLPGATFIECGNPGVTDTIFGTSPCGQLCWTPTTPGYYTVLFTAKDDNCPIIGSAQSTIQIFVSSLNPLLTATPSGCGPVDFCVSPQSGLAPFGFVWTGPNGLTNNPNATDSCLTHVYPGQGNYPFQVQISDQAGCVMTVYDTLIIPSSVSAYAGPDTTFCSGGSVTIGGPSQPGAQYTWIQGAVPNVNSSSNFLTIFNNTLVPAVYTYIIEAYDPVTTCFDYDTVQVTVNPIPTATFSLQGQVCLGDTATITYTGPQGPGADFTWDFGPGAIPPNATGIGPHDVSWASIGTKGVTLSITQYGCTSSLAVDSIIVYPIPVALIDPVSDQCFSGNNFDFINGGTYGGAAQFTWAFWTDATPVTSTQEDPTGVTFSSFGTKYALLRIVENGCVSNTDTISFEIFPQPDPSWYWLGSPQCLDVNSNCFEATGSNGPGVTYSWDFGDANPASSVLAAPCGISFNNSGYNLVTLTVTENGCIESRTDSVYVFSSPVFEAGPDNRFCEGEGGAQLWGSATSGTPVYYYTWWCDQNMTPFCGIDSINDNDPWVNPTDTTWFYGQVVDFNGCVSNIDSTFVIVMPKPHVDAGIDLTLCGDDAPCQLIQATVFGSPGPFSYAWTPTTGLSDPSILTPCARPDTTTVYSLIITDDTTGCTSFTTTNDPLSSVVVNVNPIPVGVANVGGDEIDICYGDSVMFQAQWFGAGPNYSFEWSPVTGLSDPLIQNPWASPLVTTDYIFTVWSNNCPSYGDTVQVSVHATPTADAGFNSDICLGTQTTLNGVIGGDPTSTEWTYFWWPTYSIIGSSEIQNPVVQPDSTTTYYLIGTSSFGCDSYLDSVTVFIKPTPLADAGEDTIICSGNEIMLEGSYYYQTPDSADPARISYLWTPAAGLSDPAILTPTVSPVLSSLYTLTVYYEDCENSDDVLVNVVPGISANAIAAEAAICEGESVQLTGSGGLGGATYSWLPAEGLDDASSPSPLATPGQSTIYSLIISEGMCSDTTSVSVMVYPTPVVDFYSSATSGCTDFTVNFLEATHDALAFSWDFGDGSVSNEPNPVHTYTEAGEYTVNLVAGNIGGCEATASGVIVQVYDMPDADFSTTPGSPVTLPLPNAMIQFLDGSENATQWFWDFGDGTTSTLQNPNHTYTTPGEYSVQLITVNEAGCVSEAVQGPFVIFPPDLFIPNVFSPNDDGIQDKFKVDYTGNQPFVMLISDRWGVMHFETKDKYLGWDGKGAMGNPLAEGVYYYAITVGDKKYSGYLTLMR